MSLWSKNKWGLEVIIFLLVISFCGGACSAVVINEIELNPEGADSGNEWVELYSEEEINLTNWRLSNNDGGNITLDFIFYGHHIIELNTQWLDNSEEKIVLFNGSKIIHETPLFNDPYNDDKTWQFCGSNWSMEVNTKGGENICFIEEPLEKNSSEENETEQNEPIAELEKIIELEFEEVIDADEKIKIGVNIFNFDEVDYDVKLMIYDGDKSLSEIYDENEEKWKSSNYYVDEIIRGKNSSKEFELRIKEEYYDYDEKVDLIVKIRESGKSDYEEYKERIRIRKVEFEEEIDKRDSKEETISGEGVEEEESGIIYLNSKTQEEKKEITKETGERLKEFSIYGFFIFCLIVLLTVVLKKDKL